VDERLEVEVMGRDRVVYRGEAVSVSSVNGKGKFDILPEHANFITLIGERLVIRPVMGEVVDVPIRFGLMRVLRGRVEVFLGVGG